MDGGKNEIGAVVGINAVCIENEVWVISYSNKFAQVSNYVIAIRTSLSDCNDAIRSHYGRQLAPYSVTNYYDIDGKLVEVRYEVGDSDYRVNPIVIDDIPVKAHVWTSSV